MPSDARELNETFLKLVKAVVEKDVSNIFTRKDRLLHEDKESKTDVTRLILAEKIAEGAPLKERLALKDVIYSGLSSYDKYIEPFLSYDNFADDPEVLQSYVDFFSFFVAIFATEGEILLRDKNAFLGSYAVDKCENKEYDEALRIIGEIDNGYPVKDFFKILVFEQTHRWIEVSECANKLLATVKKVRDREDETLCDFLEGAGEYYRAVAACHTHGKQKIGRNILAVIAADLDHKIYPLLKSRVLLHLALVQRSLGDEENPTSDEYFENLFIFNDDPSLIKYYENKDLHIFITSPETFEQRANPWDYTSEPDVKKYFTEVLSQKTAGDRAQVLADAKLKLANIIGLDEVKKQVLRLENKQINSQKRINILKQKWINEGNSEDSFIPPKEQVGSDHIVFKGAPGTGKTTIARIIGDIYYGVGRLRTRTFIESGRADFVGEYLGHTAIKTQKTLESALGGVLFIDEAYALVQTQGGGSDAFGQEAIDTILAFMENNRADMIVIAAGYPGDMQRFLDSNEGLRSRFGSEILFESYKIEDLLKIMETFFNSSDGLVTPGEGMYEMLADKLGKHAYAPHRSGKTVIDAAGNGRFIRNVYEESMSIRDQNIDRDDPFTVTKEDMAAAFDARIKQYLD